MMILMILEKLQPDSTGRSRLKAKVDAWNSKQAWSNKWNVLRRIWDRRPVRLRAKANKENKENVTLPANDTCTHCESALWAWNRDRNAVIACLPAERPAKRSRPKAEVQTSCVQVWRFRSTVTKQCRPWPDQNRPSAWADERHVGPSTTRSPTLLANNWAALHCWPDERYFSNGRTRTSGCCLWKRRWTKTRPMSFFWVTNCDCAAVWTRQMRMKMLRRMRWMMVRKR